MEWTSLKDELKDKEISWRIALFVYALDSFGKKGNLTLSRAANLINDCKKSIMTRGIYWPTGMEILDIIYDVRKSADYLNLVKRWGNIYERPYDWKILNEIYRIYDSSIFELKISVVGKSGSDTVNKLYAIDCKQDGEGYFYQIHDYLFFYNSGTVKMPSINKAIQFAKKAIHHLFKAPGFRWNVSVLINVPGMNRLITGGLPVTVINF